VEQAQAVTRDQKEWAGNKPTMLAYMRHAVGKSGRRPMELAREFFRLSAGPGKLSWPEYVQYGVYDTSRYPPEEQANFITNNLHWPITHKCCDMTWQATTEDKWLCSHILDHSAIRTPETLAVIDKTIRVYPETRKISTADELRDFMTSQGALPVFGKESRGICSFGAFLVTEADQEGLQLKGEGRIDYKTFLEQFVGSTPYLIQRVEHNHGFFNRFTESLATVRVCILVTENGVKTPFTILKLPARSNLADSFWRTGNLACDIEVDSGKVLTVRSKDPLGTTDHETDPETGEPLLGETLPMWDQVIEMARNCAPIFHSVRYQSMDIAITPEGPLLIEINTGGGFDLPQLASGRGFLTEDIREFFRSCGYTKV
jgi:hypothetical protein